MPQFDHGSFFNQVFWFFFIFLTSYFLLTYFFLPLVCKTLKFRKKKIEFNQKNYIDIKLENFQQQLFLNKTFLTISAHLQTTLKKVNEITLISIDPLKKHLFQKTLFKLNFLNFYTKLISFPQYFK